MQNHSNFTSSVSDPHPLALIRDILIQANALVDHHGIEALAIALNQPRPTSELVWGRSGSRALLYETLAQAKERVIIVCPWLTRQSLNDDLLLRLRAKLDQQCRIEIGWGYGHDIGSTIQIRNGSWFINARGNARCRYNALPKLCELRKHYPDLLTLKLLGTHEKFWVCDQQFAFVGNHNVLSSNVLSLNVPHVNREVGIRTAEPDVIAELIQGFEGAIDLAQLHYRDSHTA
ncbi:phospholipase D-like domain-containing protein [Leptolyngbya iicbica]|uniref:PLD phosphodiesterase domain-containing protein n=2 Tax=Cyanophyceae TaxID=3028117 RepID=A0A4Q7E3R6_9CYAN|nr:phospholipase D-like domain-containing protein [Leptolyngbya sp. LK]RZM76561.1 hypothetical protein DYY88_18020 [Leptolyngbya sp. LK]